jgi:hypothetical protein
MTYSIARVAFFGMGRLGCGAVLAAALSLAACSTSGTGSAAPAAASGQPNLVGPKDTGSYPNLNIVPRQAAPQFTSEEAQAKLAALNAERQAAQNPARAAGASDDSATLSALGRNHGKDALKQIETGCDPSLDPTCK